MTNFEKFLLALLALYVAAHAAKRYGAAAGVPAAIVSVAESVASF